MLAVGTVLKGYCGGWFDRDDYDDKRVEAVGVDWIVARYIDGGEPIFASGQNIHEVLKEYIGV